MEVLGVPFTHGAVSVFSTFEKFQAINPVVKAPTLVCADGEVGCAWRWKIDSTVDHTRRLLHLER